VRILRCWSCARRSFKFSRRLGYCPDCDIWICDWCTSAVVYWRAEELEAAWFWLCSRVAETDELTVRVFYLNASYNSLPAR